MNAKEARAVSDKQAVVVKQREEKQAKERALREKKARAEKHAEWLDNFRKNCRWYIKTATGGGRKETEITLHSGTAASDLYGRDEFLKNAEFAAEVKKVEKELVADGYTVKIIGESTEHDDSAAYMNSGGECGSMRPYWTYDTILKISW